MGGSLGTGRGREGAMDIMTRANCRRCGKSRAHKFIRFFGEKAMVECCGCLTVTIKNLAEVFQEKAERPDYAEIAR